MISGQTLDVLIDREAFMTAANPCALQLDTPCSHDTGLLVQLFDTINRRYFDNCIQAEVRWEIPSGSVSVFAGIDRETPSPTSLVHQYFDYATQLLRQNQFEAAVPWLIRCAEAGHNDAHLLLNHLLKRLGDERWESYVKRYNRHQESHKAVPAACYYPETNIIAIHPYIHERKAPQFVLKYLIFHECCHQLIDSDAQDPHPTAFMVWEQRAPGRTRALEWLEKEGFPTLTLELDAG